MLHAPRTAHRSNKSILTAGFMPAAGRFGCTDIERGTTMALIDEMLAGCGRAVILGHVRPDGDCVGSCLGLYNYIQENFPEIQADVYLEEFSEAFGYLENVDSVLHCEKENQVYDLCFCMDASDEERLGAFGRYRRTARKSICIDHHITNVGYADENHICATASATCELLFGMLDEGKITKAVAECLYTGIIHDTGVFKHQNTTELTMVTAGKLIAKGIDFGTIIDDSFYRKTYVQNQILGRALLESITLLNGKCIVSVLKKKDMDFYGVTSKDLDGIVDQLRVTDGVECAVFLYECGPQEYKVSMRSNHFVNVSQIAVMFGGGGHNKAAGCTMSGTVYDVINNLSAQIEKQIRQVEQNA